MSPASDTAVEQEQKISPLVSTVESRRDDLAAICVLIAVALIISIPALRSDMLANADTPVHLSEIRDLARPGGNGWSELGFCGFPLSLLQPPLTFGGLAWLTTLGIPLELLFRVAVVASLAVPALVFFGVARRRLNVGWALGLAVTLPLYRASLSGEASALSGMFSFYFAAAALWALADVLVRPSRSLRDVAVIAAFVGFIGASHMYVTIALVYLAVVHAGWSSLDRAKLRRLIYDVPGFVLGTLAAACYWLPNLLAHTSALRIPESLGRIATRLVTSSARGHDIPLTIVDRLTLDPIFHVDAALQLVTLVLVVLAAKSAWRSTDDLPRYGLTLAGALLSGMALARITGLPLIGPTGTRLVFIAKMGLLASCMPFLRTIANQIALKRLLAAVTVGALGFAFLMQRIVAEDSMPKSNPAMHDVENLWAWIRTHHDRTWGRLYLQDTFGAPIKNPLDTSHVLVRTAELTGAEQVGAFYGLTPYAQDWLTVDTFAADGFLRAKEALDRANVTHLLILNAGGVDLVKAQLTELVRFGQFAVVSRNDVKSAWSSVLEGSGTVQTERLAPGRIRLNQIGSATALSVSESYHPFWKVEPSKSGAKLSADAFGMMRVDAPLSESRALELVYAPPATPWVLSIFAGTVIVALFAFTTLRRPAPRTIG